jgi:uncharacterized protein (DUF302 family)
LDDSKKIEGMSYYFTKITTLEYEQALTRVQEELKKEGFGIITEIDVRETLKQKLRSLIDRF